MHTIVNLSFACIFFAVHDGTVVANRPKYRGLLHAAGTIVKEDGLRGLFRVSGINLPYMFIWQWSNQADIYKKCWLVE